MVGGSIVGFYENYFKIFDLQDSDIDIDIDCEGMGSKQMVVEDLYQWMSVVYLSFFG